VTRLEAYRAALSAAVRDGDTAVVKALTREITFELTSGKHSQNRWRPQLGTFCISSSEKRQDGQQ
jgi:hypothetical protein